MPRSTLRLRPTTLKRSLRLSFGALAAITLGCFGFLLWRANDTNNVAHLQHSVLVNDTGPIASLGRAIDLQAAVVSRYRRTHAAADFAAADAGFDRLIQSTAYLRVRLAAIDRPTWARVDQELGQISALLLQWHHLLSRQARDYSRSDRSTRGLASQISLLTSIGFQLLKDDGKLAPGLRAPGHETVLAQTMACLAEIQNGILFAHASNDPSHLERISSKQEGNLNAFALLLATTEPSDLREFLDDIHSRLKDLNDERASLFKLMQANLALVQQLDETEGVVRATLHPLRASSIALSAETADLVTASVDNMVLALVIAAVLTPFLALACGRLLSGSVGRVLNPFTESVTLTARGALGTASAARSGGDELAALSRRQADGVRNVQDTARDLTRGSAATSDSIARAVQEIEAARERAQSGRVSVAQLEETIRQLDQSSVEVTSTAATVEEIAFQTGLLALNAAVEAARAGAAGRGFAVVAEEVGALAKRSAKAARTTSEIIGRSSTATREGRRVSEAVREEFQAIAEQVQAAASQLESCSREVPRQTANLRDLSAEIDAIGNAAHAVARQADEFKGVTSSLDGNIRQFDRVTRSLLVFLDRREPANSPPDAEDANPATHRSVDIPNGRRDRDLLATL